MKEYIDYKLANGVKLIYKNTFSHLSSISIALDAGAGRDFKEKLGIAHVTEHMIYKGTANRTEAEINKAFSSIFGFQNAMTNYPYVVYYGTLLDEDLAEGIELFSDIITNPLLSENGFKEEMEIIKEELREWDEEAEQYCEDQLFINAFSDRRIKYPIIGRMQDLEQINIQDVKEFYASYYFPENTTITVISAASFDKVKEIVEKYFASWEQNGKIEQDILLEEPKGGKYIAKRNNINTSKILMAFSLNELSINELKLFRLFNEYFGEGINSLLFDELRTKKALVYDVLTKISNENYLNLYKITFSTAKENADLAIETINRIIKNLTEIINSMEEEEIEQLVKKMKLRRYFIEEQSIRLANLLSTYDRMFGDYKIYPAEVDFSSVVKKKEIIRVVEKLFKNPCIQIVEY